MPSDGIRDDTAATSYPSSRLPVWAYRMKAVNLAGAAGTHAPGRPGDGLNYDDGCMHEGLTL